MKKMRAAGGLSSWIVVMKDLPRYLLDLLDHELDTVQRRLLQRVAARYALPYEEMCTELLVPVRLVPSSETHLEVIKRMAPKPPPAAECRCMGRVWNKGQGGQCRRVRVAPGDFCMQHDKQCKHGRIDEPPPAHFTPKNEGRRPLYR